MRTTPLVERRRHPKHSEGLMVKRNSATRDKHRARIRRDQPACHICGKPIDYTLPHLDPMAFVIDHVIPLAQGGRDAIDNIKAAHRECNSKKRARLIAPIVRRSGSLD
jgi:5-methylcytosine-specific restriction endonuclease McrA